MSPWQTPNFSASTMAEQMTNFTTQWQQACTKWQSSIEGFSTTPAAFWQSVSSIQSAQAKFVSEFLQRQPEHFSALMQCKSIPQLIECVSRWNGHNLTAAINLGAVVQAHRSSFFAQWQRQFPTTANTTALANMWKSGLNNLQNNAQSNAFSNSAHNFADAFTTTINTFVAAANNAATQAQASTAKATSSTPTAGTVSTASTSTQQSNQSGSIAQAATSATQTQTAQATQQPTAQIIAAPSATAHTSLTQPDSNEQLTLLNGTNGSAVISSTANSVMRSSTGSTIAAAAARRSVVARRTANNRRRAPR